MSETQNTNSEIQVESITLSELFKKNLVIPEYQRPYKWKEKNVIQLLNDIWEAMNREQKIYRVGTIILHKEAEKLNIVDGQQRLVTITLILHYLGEGQEGQEKLPLLKSNFSHTDSKNNIAFNYNSIKNWFNGFSEEQKKVFKKYILENCEFIKIELNNISEAFQLFDSQNARGKALEPYDLLKAFHLREMKENTESERLTCVKGWEKAVNQGLLNNLGKYLFRIRKWARGEDAKEFSKNDIDEFKGMNLHTFKNYPYLKSYLLNDSLINEMSKNPMNQYFGANIQFPYQITQMIINGKRFFGYIDFYTNLYHNLFKKENFSEFTIFYKKACYYWGHHRIGDIYVREMFEASILLYIDKFGDTDFLKVSEILYKWSYKLRLKQPRVAYTSIDKYIRENQNIFKLLYKSYFHQEILKVNIQMPENEIVYKIIEVQNIFNPTK